MCYGLFSFSFYISVAGTPVCHSLHMCVKVREQVGVSSPFLLWGQTGHQCWWRASLPTEPSCGSLGIFIQGLM